MVPELLEIGLDAWIVQDGNYPDFEVGREYSFAVEFFSEDLAKLPHPSKPGISCRRKGSKGFPQYNVVGEVIHVDEEWLALDAGIRAYRELGLRDVSPGFRKGDWVEGVLSYCVDHFSYQERYGRRAKSPGLIYDWRIERIRIETAPFVQVAEKAFERDKSKLGWREIDRTNCHEDDGGHGAYCLACRRMNEQPRRP